MNDLLNAIAGLSHTIYQDEDKKKRIAADAELRAQQVDLQKWQADEMNKFSNRIDFENFQNDYEKDFAAKYAQYNTKKGENAYNSIYTATRGNEMFDQLKANSQIALDKVIQQQQISYANVMDKKTLDTLRTLPAGEDRVREEVKVVRQAASENRMSRDQEYNELNKIWNQNYYESALTESNLWMQQHPGATEEDFNTFLDSIGEKLETPSIAIDSLEGPVEIKGDKDATLDAAKKVMQQKVYDMQKETNNSVYAANSDIILDVALGRKSTNELISDLKNQINLIEVIPNLQINEQDKRARQKELMGILDAFEKKEEQAAEDAEKKKNADKEKKEKELKAKKVAFSTLINNDYHTFIEAAKVATDSSIAEGAISAYAARSAFLDKYIKIGEEEYGIEANKIKLDYANRFMEDIQKEYNHDPKVISVLNQVKDVLKGYINKKDVNYEDLQAETMSYLWDMLFDSNMSKLDTEGIVDNTKKFIENITAKELTLEKIKKDGPLGLTGDYDLPKALQNLSTNDYAWTDDKGVQHFNEKAYDTVIDKIIPEQVDALYTVGVKGHLQVEEAPVSETGYDIDLNPVYKDEDGNVYEFKSIDKDNYDIYMNGQKYSNSKQVKDARNGMKKEVREKINKERERIKKERENVKKEAIKIKEQDKVERNTLAQSVKAPPHVEQEEWQKLDLSQRTALLTQYRTLYPEEYKELLKGANK